MRPRAGRWFGLFLLGLGIVVVLYRLRHVVFLFIAAVFLSYLLEPLVVALQRRGASRQAAVLSVFILIGLLLVGGMALLLPALAQELGKALRVLPAYLGELGRITARLGAVYRRLHLPEEVQTMTDRLITRARLGLEHLLGTAFSALLGFISGSFSFLLLPLISYYFSRDYPRAVERLAGWSTARSRPDLLVKLAAVDRTLRVYFRALALELLVTTFMLVLGLFLLRVEFALLLGVLAGILNIIPYFGPLVGAVPAVLLALTRSPWRGMAVVILFLLVNQLETTVLIPRLIGPRIGLHPLFVLFSLLAGGELFGLPGLIFSVPVAAVLKTVVVEYTRHPPAHPADLTTPRPSTMMEEKKTDPP